MSVESDRLVDVGVIVPAVDSHYVLTHLHDIFHDGVESDPLARVYPFRFHVPVVIFRLLSRLLHLFWKDSRLFRESLGPLFQS